MRRIGVCFFIASSIASVAFAAGPIARVSSALPFQLRGALVPVAGVSSWPVLAGDSIATGDAAATIHFLDGTSVVLAQHSTARVEELNGRNTVRLLGGTMQATRAAGSTVAFLAQERLLTTPAGKPTTTTIKPLPLLKGPPPPPPPGPPPPPPPPPVSRR